MLAPENGHTGRLVDMVTALGGEEMVVNESGTVHFVLGDVPAFAYTKQGGSRIRGTVILDVVKDPAEAEAWAADQPQPEAGFLEVADTGQGEYLFRLLFERSIDDDGLHLDPLWEEAQLYADCWHERADVELVDVGETFAVPCDPRDIEPVNAWLLLGDGASFPSKDELLAHACRGDRGIFANQWTTSKQTDVGDLVLVYFTAPRKAACFVARAASRAFFDASIGVRAQKKVADEQWWCFLTPLIEIEPIPFAVLEEAAGGFLQLHGRSGVYLRPEIINVLPINAKKPSDRDALARVLVPPVGCPELPTPDTVTARSWSNLASGALALESQVEQYVVEPLLRLALHEHPGAAWQKAYRIGRKVADYAVIVEDAPSCVIEVKLAVRESPNGVWEDSKDFQQVRGYADALGCRSALVDANRVYLISEGASEPDRIIERRMVTTEDLKEIGTHFGAHD